MSDWSSEVCPSDLKAGDCLDGRTKALRGRTLTEVMPEADELLAEARRRPRKLAERQLAIPDASGAERVLLVRIRSEEHTSDLQSLMRISYDGVCLKKKKDNIRR